jgi:hypothetical protein
MMHLCASLHNTEREKIAMKLVVDGLGRCHCCWSEDFWWLMDLEGSTVAGMKISGSQSESQVPPLFFCPTRTSDMTGIRGVLVCGHYFARGYCTLCAVYCCGRGVQ